jgi:hypothetical protein
MRDRTVREVQLNEDAHETLAPRVEALAEAYVGNDVELHDYSPGFKPEEGGHVALDFELPDPIWRCRASLPNDVPVLEKGKPSASDVRRGR